MFCFYKFVAVTDLSPFAINGPTKRFGYTLTNQGQSALILSSSLELFFLVLFGSRPTVREQLVSSQDRPLSHPLLRIPLGTPSLKNTLLRTQKKQPCGRSHELFTSVTHTSYRLMDQHTNRRHQKGHFLTLTLLLLLK